LNDNDDSSFRDFGPGLTVDELIGVPAFQLSRMRLPPGRIFSSVRTAAKKMVNANLESFVLLEIWEDGHTVWHSLKDESPAVITPGGHLIRTKN
jgi:hypothetical protein